MPHWIHLYTALLFLGCVAVAQDATSAVRELRLATWHMHSTADPDTNFTVSVPNSVMGALLEINHFPFDPFYGKNLQRINESLFAVPWVFETEFALTAVDVGNAAAVLLCFEGINYRGNVTLNNHVIADERELVGAMRRFEFIVTPAVVPGINRLRVSLSRAQLSSASWRNPSTDLAIDFYDWNPPSPDNVMGLLRPVYVRVVAPGSGMPLVRFDGFSVRTELSRQRSPAPGRWAAASSEGNGFVARLNISVNMRNVGATPLEPSLMGGLAVFLDLGLLLNPTKLLAVPLQRSLQPGADVRMFFTFEEFPADLIIDDPPLWYPWEMSPGPRPLFNATVGLIDRRSSGSSAGTRLEWASWRFALREVSRTTTRFNALQMMINKVPLLIRGGGYAPDMFYRINDRVDLVRRLSLIRSMGLNTVRLEGKMMTSEFFNICDELGLLVMIGIGCCDGWQNWDEWPKENWAIAFHSVVSQARRLAPHPSIMTFLVSSDLLPPPRLEALYNNALEQEAWPSVVLSSAEGWFSTITGPNQVKMSGSYSWEPPNYWLEDSGMMLNNGTMNYGGAFGFLTEGGPGESPMTYNSWNRTTPVEHQWEPDEGGSLSPWWNFHCGQSYGHFGNLSRYTAPLDARYGASASAREFLFRSQVANLEGIRAMFEGYSQQKHINATGIIQWQIQMAWPSNIWTLYDEYLQAHGGFFGARGSCGAASMYPMLSPVDGTIWLIHNRFEEFPGVVRVNAELLDISGETLLSRQQTVTRVASDASLLLRNLTLPIADRSVFPPWQTFFVRLHWSLEDATGDAPALEKWYWLSSEMDVLGPWNETIVTWYQTPCRSWANLTQLNVLAPVGLSATFSQLIAEDGIVYRDPGAAYVAGDVQTRCPSCGAAFRVSISNNGTGAPGAARGVAFFIQVRLVDPATGFDVTPIFFPPDVSDNFFSLKPGGSRTLLIEAPSLTAEVAARVHLEVEWYNRIVVERALPMVVQRSDPTPIPSPTGGPTPAPTPAPPSNQNADGSNTALIATACASAVLGTVAVVQSLRYRVLQRKGDEVTNPGDEAQNLLH